MTPSFVSAWERGASSPGEETISLLTSVFGVNPEWVRDGEEPMFLPGEEKAPTDIEGIGERVKKIRKKTGLSQIELGRRIGFSRSQVGVVETGKSIPSADFLQKVAEVYEVNYDWLMAGEGDIKAEKKDLVDEELIAWLRANPEVVRELRNRNGLD